MDGNIPLVWNPCFHLAEAYCRQTSCKELICQAWNDWKLEISFLFKNKKLAWSGRHRQHALWKLQQTFQWYRSTTWLIYQRRHLPTIDHQGKSRHGSQAAHRNTDKRITTMHANKKLTTVCFSTRSWKKKRSSSQDNLWTTSQSHNYFKTTANSVWRWFIMSINCQANGKVSIKKILIYLSTLRQQVSRNACTKWYIYTSTRALSGTTKMAYYTFWWPVMRAFGCLLIVGSQRNIVKSSEPETSLSGALPLIFLYLARAA